MKRIKYSFFVAVLSCLLPANSLAQSSTNVTVVGRPIGTFKSAYGGANELRSASVKARNTGTIEAKDVRVEVIVPSGRSGQLRGPKTLRPGETADYSSSYLYIPVTKDGKLKGRASCSNCGVNATSGSSNDGPTSLSAKRPIGVFETSGGTVHLIDGTVEVRNTGPNTARGVRVKIKLPAGNTVNIRGPKTIGPYKKQTYRSRLYEVITSTRDLKAVVSCSNCR